MIHPPDVVDKYVPDAIFGLVGSEGELRSRPCLLPLIRAMRLQKGLGRLNRAINDTPGVLLLTLRAYVNVCCYLIFSIIYEIRATIVSAKNSEVSND